MATFDMLLGSCSEYINSNARLGGEIYEAFSSEHYNARREVLVS